ncbi:alpha/beta hydrolase family protein [Roseomonas sp. F4]
MTLRPTRRALIAHSALALPGSAQAAEAVVLPGGLHGTLLRPSGPRRGLACLLLPGSGPTDRDGNQPGLRNDALRLLAEGLADAGIATLRMDKRGVAASRAAIGQEEDLTPHLYAEDAARALDHLAAQPGIDRLALLGHSEGGVVALLAARLRPVAALVLLATPGFRAADLLRRQLTAAPMPGDLRAASLDILARLEGGEAVADVPPPLMPLFRPSVQPYLRAWFALDPAELLRRLSVPTLVMQGQADLQVSAEDARRLAAAREGVALALVPGMNHVLRESPADREGNLALYDRPGVPLHPAVVRRIVAHLVGAGP